MKPPCPLLVLAILSMAVVPLAGQETAAGGRLAAVFTIQDLSTGASTREYEDAITESVSAAFRANGYDVVAPEKWQEEARRRALQPRALLSEPAAVAAARATGAGIAVTGYYSVDGESIYVSLQCWDVASGVLAVGLQQTTQFDIGFYGALFGQVTGMLSRIQLSPLPRLTGSGQTTGPAQQSTPAASTSKAPVLTDITFLSPDEGMELFLAGGTRIGAIQDGRLLWQGDGLPAGTRFTVEKRKGGFHTGVETVRAAEEVRLRGLVAERARALEVDWTFGQLAGLGATLRAYALPDMGFLFLGNYFYVQPPLSSAGFTVLHYDVSAGAGTYLIFPPDSWIRLGVSTGAGSVFTLTTGPASAGYSDVYWDVFNWWIETRVLGPVVFLRQEWKFTLGRGLLGMQFMNVANIPPFTLGVVFRW